MLSLQDGSNALAVAPRKSFQSLVISAPWLFTGDTAELYRGGTVSGSTPDGLFGGGTLNGATLLESVSLSSLITAITS